MSGQPGFFDVQNRYEALSRAGDPLEGLRTMIPWESFRKPLKKTLQRKENGLGGRPPFDDVLMFKVLVLQALYNLSDDRTEYRIRDRLSFVRFPGLGMDGTVPDAKTIRLFRERLARAGAVEKLFVQFAVSEPEIVVTPELVRTEMTTRSVSEAIGVDADKVLQEIAAISENAKALRSELERRAGGSPQSDQIVSGDP